MQETRKLNTILFADIAGFTSIMHSNEARAMKYLQLFKKLLENKVSKYEGQIIQYFGDACLLSFDSATLGVKCAISLQQDFQVSELPVRIGMHLGEVIFTENNAFGDGVNIASRIESMGIPDSVLVSEAIRDQIKNKHEFKLRLLGSFEFKNVEEPMKVYALENNGLSVPVKSKLVGKFKTPKQKSRIFSRSNSVLSFVDTLFSSFSKFKNKSDSSSTALYPKNSIAVLPLINLNNEEIDYFSDGVTQEIIDELAKISSITVSAFTTTYQYKNQQKEQREIAQELEVNYLISGSSRFFENEKRVKLSIELIDPYHKKRIWNRTFDEHLNNAPSIQLAVAKEVAQNLDIELTIGEEKDLKSPNTLSGEAFRYFLHAKAEVNKMSPEGFQKGASYLENAIKLDPKYGQAYSLLAWRYGVGGSADFIPGIITTTKSYALAKPVIDKAIELNPRSSDNYVIRAFLNLYLLNKIQDAKVDIERAFALKSWPKVPINYCICTAVSAYIAVNNLEKAKEVARFATEIDPGHALYDWDLGNIAMKEGNYTKAQVHYQNSVHKFDFHFFNTFLGWSYYYNAQYDKALKFLNIAYENSELPARFTLTTLSNTYLRMGDKQTSDKYLNELLDRSESGEHHLNLYIANVYLERENVEKSLNYLEKGVEYSDFGFAIFLSLMPKFKSLEGEPRFEEVLRKIQSPGM